MRAAQAFASSEKGSKPCGGASNPHIFMRGYSCRNLAAAVTSEYSVDPNK